MATKIYTFKITYADCGNKIWRIAAISSNCTLADLGYMVLATFDTKAYHMFEMRYKNTIYFLNEEDFEEIPAADGGKYEILWQNKLGSLDMAVGDKIEMSYDYGCNQVFIIEFIDIADMPKGHGKAYPKILDGAGNGIVDDMPADELLKAIKKTDAEEHSGVYYSSIEFGQAPEWDYRNYKIDLDNMLLKGTIARIRDGHENFED